MSQTYCAVRISPHMARDANGTLICLGATICRSGYQTYKASEVDPTTDDDTEVQILRPVSEVTSPATIASFEGVDLTLRHPAKFIDPDTHAWSARGHAQNIRVGEKDKEGNVQLVADLFIKDRSLQEAIERGVRDLSCGYRYDLVQLSNGAWAQINIRGNHIAVVEDGRSGTSKIMDAKDGDMDGKKLDRLCDLLEKLLEMRGPGSEEEESEAAEDEVPEAEYERTGGPERKLKSGPDLIPVNGAGAEGNVNPLSAKDARAALLHLRNLRGFVERNGDRQAVDAYNTAIKTIKAQIALAEGFDPRSSAYDSRSRRQDDAADFERSAARFHGKAIPVHSQLPDDHNRAEDSREREESFDEAVARVRQEQMDRWTPKKRR
jgi:hypothetical protein